MHIVPPDTYVKWNMYVCPSDEHDPVNVPPDEFPPELEPELTGPPSAPTAGLPVVLLPQANKSEAKAPTVRIARM
ncbi:MAG TPA: hypothetical protein VGM06_06305 [Polyangiaceae bacterium]|jgi:hypothetical protein